MLSLYFLGEMATDLDLDQRYIDLLTEPRRSAERT